MISILIMNQSAQSLYNWLLLLVLYIRKYVLFTLYEFIGSDLLIASYAFNF